MLFLPFMTFLPQSFLPLTHAVLPSSACFPQGGLWCPSPVDAPFGLWILLDPGIPPDTPGLSPEPPSCRSLLTRALSATSFQSPHHFVLS